MELNDLTQSDIITLFSIILTFVSIPFGIWGIYVTAYRVKYPGRLIYTPVKTVNIYDSIIKSFPDFSVKHNEVEIENELVYHRSAIINTGKIDIKKDMIEEPIRIFLKNGEWKEAKIKSSPSVKSSISIGVDKQSLYLETGLLRIDEAIHYEALATLNGIPDNLPVTDHIKILHRISDIDSIEKSERISIENINYKLDQNKYNRKLIYILLIFGLIFPAIILNTTPSTSATITYPNTESIFTLSEITESNLKLTNLNSFFNNKQIHTDSVSLSKIRYNPLHLSYFQKSRVISNVYFMPIMIFSYCLLLSLFFYRERKKYMKLQKIFTLSSE
jgi:hypothetical protein